MNVILPKACSLSIVAFLIFSAASHACCTAWGHGSRPVEIADQEVLLVWDAERGVEHFVRRASFRSEAAPKDFGFLVPTPTQPKLTEIPDRVFHDLGEVIKPKEKIEKKTRFSFMPLMLYPLLSTAGVHQDERAVAMKFASVEVLDTAVVGGFEAAVLRASETGELLKWLEENGYDARPEIREWVTPYVEKKWIVTAFKYASDSEKRPASLTRASVCLSFETETPFFPYRVPSDVRVKPEEGALLRLYFAGTQRVSGKFEGGDEKPWNAAIPYSDRTEGIEGILKKIVPDSGAELSLPDALWLTAFEDDTWPGGAADLYFETSVDQDAINPDPIMKSQVRVIHLPSDLLLLCLAGGIYLYRRRVKRRALA